MSASADERARVAVALIAKAPEPGQVKTRFCPPCTPAEAAGFARAFLADTAAMVTGNSFADLDVWCSYAGDASLLREVLPSAVRLLPQRGSGLGARLANTAADLFAEGYARVVLLGADCPTVDTGYLRQALVSLQTCDVVLGPADDGGYVLIGLHTPDPTLFESVEMGTERVLTQTLVRAGQAGYSVAVLDLRHDLDTIAELTAASAAGQLMHARETSALLAASPWAASTASRTDD